MKLTALAGSTTRVELFAIADRQASAEGFRCAAADRYRGLTPDGLSMVAPHYAADRTGCTIGHPDVCALMWEGCIVTRLSADLAPEAMDRDVELSLGPLRPQRDHVFSARGRAAVVGLVLLLGGLPIVIYLAVVFRLRRRCTRWQAAGLAGIILLLGISAVVVSVALPVIPVRTGSYGGPWGREFHYRASELIAAGQLHRDLSADQLDRMARMLAGRTNPYTGEPMRLQRSPGNCSIRRVGDRAYLCFYDADAREYRAELPPAPAATQASSTRAES
jgi:hypothetical protein